MASPYDNFQDLVKSGPNTYFSATDAALYINDRKVPTTTSINWQIQDTRVPLYGYNDRTFRTMTKGKIQINGSIEVNFYYRGFFELFMVPDKKQIELLKALDDSFNITAAVKSNKERGRALAMESVSKNDVLSYIQGQVSDSALNNAQKDDRLRDMSDFLSKKFSQPTPKDNEGDHIYQSEFSIDIFYDNINRINPNLGKSQISRNHLTREGFRGCFLTGKSRTIRAEVGGPDGGGSPLLEVYYFAARETY